MLPTAVKAPLLDHLARVKAQHEADVAAGRGSVAMPGALQAKYPIIDIVGHSDIAPGRKTDPGPCFDWARYRELLERP